MITGLVFTIIVATIASFAGMLGSLVGIGGGVIITPLLLIGFGIDIHYAMGAALCGVIANSAAATISYLDSGIANLKIGLFFGIATTLGATVGALLSTHASSSLLMLIFGIILLATLFFSFIGKEHPPVPPDHADPIAQYLDLTGSYPVGKEKIAYGLKNVIPGFLAMAVAGLLSGLLGIGSGVFKVVAMDHIMKTPFRVSTATSSFMIGVTATASAGIYLKKGYIDPVLAAPIVLGVLLGAFLGAKLMPYLPLRLLKALFMMTIIAIGFEMIHRGIS